MNPVYIIKDNNAKKGKYVQAFTPDAVILGKKQTAFLFDDQCYAITTARALEEKDVARSYSVKCYSPPTKRVTVKGTAVCLGATLTGWGNVKKVWLIRSEEGNLYYLDSASYKPVEKKNTDDCYPVYICGSVVGGNRLATRLAYVKNIDQIKL